jgi:hypothetical protein
MELPGSANLILSAPSAELLELMIDAKARLIAMTAIHFFKIQ